MSVQQLDTRYGRDFHHENNPPVDGSNYVQWPDLGNKVVVIPVGSMPSFKLWLGNQSGQTLNWQIDGSDDRDGSFTQQEGGSVSNGTSKVAFEGVVDTEYVKLSCDQQDGVEIRMQQRNPLAAQAAAEFFERMAQAGARSWAGYQKFTPGAGASAAVNPASNGVDGDTCDIWILNTGTEIMWINGDGSADVGMELKPDMDTQGLFFGHVSTDGDLHVRTETGAGGGDEAFAIYLE